MQLIKERLMDSPVIAAVKEDAGLRQALRSDCQVIFRLSGCLENVILQSTESALI